MGRARRLELGLFTSQRQGSVVILIAVDAIPGAVAATVAYGVAAPVVAIAYVTIVGKQLLPDTESSVAS